MRSTKRIVLESQPLAKSWAWWDVYKRYPVSYSLTNQHPNGDFSDGTTGWNAINSVLSVSETNLLITGNGTGEYPRTSYALIGMAVPGKKLYFRLKARVTNTNATSLYAYLVKSGGTSQYLPIVSNPVQNQWYTVSGVLTIPANFVSGDCTLLIAHSYADAATSNNKVMEIDSTIGIVYIDLSDEFGTGNETASGEMDAIFTGFNYLSGSQTFLCNPLSRYFWHDSSNNGRHMKLNNMAYTSASGWDISGYNSLSLDGTNDHSIYGATEINAANTSFSAMVAFKIPNTTGAKHILSCSRGTAEAMTLSVSTATLTLLITDSTSGTASTTYTVAANKWYIAHIVYNQSSKTAFLYINGLLVGTSEALTNGLQQITKIKSGINTAENAYSAGNIGMISLFSKSLTDTEVRMLHSANRRRFGI